MAENGSTHVHMPAGGYGGNGGFAGSYSPFSSIEHLGIVNRVSDVGTKVLDSICDTSSKNMMATCDNARFTNKEVSDATRFTHKEVADSTRLLAKDICDTKGEIHGAVAASAATIREGQQVLSLNVRDAVERNGAATLLSTERNANESRYLTANVAGEIRDLINRNNTSTLISAKDVLLEQCKEGAITNKNVDSVKYNLCETENRLGRQADTNTANIQLEAFKHKESLARQLAECCCELKEKIDARANETNLLIREVDTQRVRDELAKSNTENLILKLRQNTPI
jgi:hypothetical protein